jgi:hypothetical protein
MPDVLLVTIACGAMRSIFAKSSCLGCGFSMIASTIQSQRARRSRWSAVLPVVTRAARSVSRKAAGLALMAF